MFRASKARSSTNSQGFVHLSAAALARRRRRTALVRAGGRGRRRRADVGNGSGGVRPLEGIVTAIATIAALSLVCVPFF